MGASQFRLTRQALAHLDDISDYLGQRNQSAADRVIDALVDCFALLGRSPELGTKRDDLRLGVRIYTPRRPAHNYVVVFRPESPGVKVIAILHGAREWAELLASDEGE